MSISTPVNQSMTQEGLALFLQEIIVEYASYKNNVRRVEPRESVSIPVEARRIDENNQPVGGTYHLVTKDISCGGLGLFNLERIENGPIQLKLDSPVTGRSIAIIANVEHCTPCGKYFIVGCRFQRASRVKEAK